MIFILVSCFDYAFFHEIFPVPNHEVYSSLLLFHSKNCPHFRKLFPEYVEKYNQQQEKEQTGAEPEPQENPAPAPSPAAVQQAAAMVNNIGRPVAEVRGEKKLKKRVPFWLMVVIVSVFGAVMALPLMQL